MEKITDAKETYSTQRTVAYATQTPILRTNKTLVVAHCVYAAVYATVAIFVNFALLQECSFITYYTQSHINSTSSFGITISLNPLRLFTRDSDAIGRIVAFINTLLFVSAIISIRLVFSSTKYSPSKIFRATSLVVYVAVAALNIIVLGALAVAKNSTSYVHTPPGPICLMVVASIFFCVIHGIAIVGLFSKNRPLASRCLPYSTVFEENI